MDTILRDECRVFGGGRGRPGGGDFFAGFFFGGEGVVQGEEEGEGVGVMGHAVGGADGGVEFGVGVALGVGAGFFQRLAEVAQGVVQFPL